VKGKTTGIFDVGEPDLLPFWKKTLEYGGDSIKIDTELLKEI